jgi:hypothetical protein
MTAVNLSKRTPAQRRQLLTSFTVDGNPVRLTMRDGAHHDVELVGMAQEERSEADPYSQRGSLLVGRFYATKALLVLRLADLQSIELLELSPTDPNHPDYEREEQVVRPIPREALASRKTREATRHDQL